MRHQRNAAMRPKPRSPVPAQFSSYLMDAMFRLAARSGHPFHRLVDDVLRKSGFPYDALDDTTRRRYEACVRRERRRAAARMRPCGGFPSGK